MIYIMIILIIQSEKFEGHPTIVVTKGQMKGANKFLEY